MAWQGDTEASDNTVEDVPRLATLQAKFGSNRDLMGLSVILNCPIHEEDGWAIRKGGRIDFKDTNNIPEQAVETARFILQTELLQQLRSIHSAITAA